MNTVEQQRRRMPTLISITLLMLFWAFVHPHNSLGQWGTGSNGTDVVTTNSSSNVGVGTSSPEQPGSAVRVVDVRGSNGGGLTFGTTGGAKSFLYRWADANTYFDYSGGDFILQASGEKFRFTNNGNFGIGTSAPSTRLEINGPFVSGKGTLYVKGVSDHGYIYVDTSLASTKEAGFNIAKGGVTKWGMYVPANSNDLRFFDSTDRFTLQAGGNVGIGTTNPGSLLHLYKNDTVISSRIILENTASTNYTAADIRMRNAMSRGAGIYTYNATNGNWFWGNMYGATDKFGINYKSGSEDDATASYAYNLFTVQSNGNVGIGTTAPKGRLQVNDRTLIGQLNTVAATYSFFSNNAYYSSGWKYVTSDYTSLIQLKEDLVFYTAAPGTADAAIPFNERFRIINNGNVGIGTGTPAYKLDVAGQIRSSSGGFVFPDGTVQTTASSGGGGSTQWTTESTGISYMGNAGIGTTNPTALQGGLTGLSGRVFQIQNSAGLSQFNISSSGAGNSAYLSFEVGDGTVGKRVFQQFYDGAANALRFRTLNEANGTITQENILILKNTGSIGIGTTNPQSSLHVYKQNNSALTSVIADNDGTGTNTGQAFLFGYGNTGVLGGIYHQFDGTRWVLRFKAWTSTGSEIERLLIQGDTGNIGIGVATPAYKLDVTGQINASTGFCIAGVCKATWSEIGGAGSQWTTSSSNIYYSTGRVGIGTDNPTSPLSVIDAGNTAAVNIIQSNASASNGLSIQTQTASASDAALLVRSNAGATTGLVVRNNGNVGIGVAAPQAALDVNGSINVSGNINAKYQDVAEWVPSIQKLAPGTVVILDPDRSNQVIASIQSYDTRVAGVISEQPGVLLGEAGEGKVKVATTGRVKVRVDASLGAIKIGDLLVTSDTGGMAMKSVPVNFNGRMIHTPGTIIGKALEPLDKGKGEILVLLSLQ